MLSFKDRSTQHNTTLETVVTFGHRRVVLSVSVVGRDVWAYQTAKIRLQDKVIAHRRAHASMVAPARRTAA